MWQELGLKWAHLITFGMDILLVRTLVGPLKALVKIEFVFNGSFFKDVFVECLFTLQSFAL